MFERLDQRRTGRQRCHGLEPVGAVVAVQHRGVGVWKGALEMVLEELVGFLLAVGHLQRLGKLDLIAFGFDRAMDPSYPGLRDDRSGKDRKDHRSDECPPG